MSIHVFIYSVFSKTYVMVLGAMPTERKDMVPALKSNWKKTNKPADSNTMGVTMIEVAKVIFPFRAIT